MTELGVDEVSLVSGGKTTADGPSVSLPGERTLNIFTYFQAVGDIAAALNDAVWNSRTFPGNDMFTDPSSKYAQNGHDKQDNDSRSSGGGASSNFAPLFPSLPGERLPWEEDLRGLGYLY